MRLSGKVALVLPGTFGVGHDAAVHFAREGARVLVAGASEANGAKTVEAVARAGGSAHFARCDLLREEDIRAAVEAAVERFGGLDLAFGCPDHRSPGTLTEMTAEALDFSLAYNCRSLFFLAKHAMPRLAVRGGGSLVFLTSVYGVVSGSVSCAYEVSKGTVLNMTRSIADRWASRRVRVSCIVAGHTVEAPRDLADETGHAHLVREEEEVERLSKFYPTGRLILPEEIARAAAFLASDDAMSVTGSAIFLDGGFCGR